MSEEIWHTHVKIVCVFKGIDDHILKRFEQTLQKFSDFLELVKVHGYPTAPQLLPEKEHSQASSGQTPDMSLNSSL